MTAVYIILAILFVLLLLLAARIRITLLYRTDVQVYLKVWFIRICLHPRKKKVRIRDFEYKHLKRKKRKQKAEKPAKKAKQEKKQPLTHKIQFYVRIFKALYEKFLKYFRIDVARIQISVATGDAAQTAIVYGVVSQVVAYICEILHQHTNFHPKNRTAIAVAPDFVGVKSHADCNVTFSLRVWQIAHLGLRFAHAFFKNKTNKTATVNK